MTFDPPSNGPDTERGTLTEPTVDKHWAEALTDLHELRQSLNHVQVAREGRFTCGVYLRDGTRTEFQTVDKLSQWIAVAFNNFDQVSLQVLDLMAEVKETREHIELLEREPSSVFKYISSPNLRTSKMLQILGEIYTTTDNEKLKERILKCLG